MKALAQQWSFTYDVLKVQLILKVGERLESDHKKKINYVFGTRTRDHFHRPLGGKKC